MFDKVDRFSQGGTPPRPIRPEPVQGAFEHFPLRSGSTPDTAADKLNEKTHVMETKGTNEREARFGWRDALAGLAGGAAFCGGFILLCCEPANDGPITWEFILGTKVGGLALLLLAGWLYRRFIFKGGRGDDDRA